MDLPTYTNIWRIEKRLYKLYDFRLPMPLPISWIAVFCGITVPYVGILAAIGLPFNHNLVALYVLPPGVLTWLATRPVLENKRLHELLVSQFRYIGEPRTWCRLVPLSEKNEIRVYARVWHRAPAYAEDAHFLTEAGAAWLAGHKAALVGIDAVNIDDTSSGGHRPAHSVLLAAGIPIVEHLTGLGQLPPTGSRFSAVPPRIAELGIFPVRAYASLMASGEESGR